MKKIIRAVLHRFGFSLVKTRFYNAPQLMAKAEGNMLGGLLRSKDIGINPATIVDAGAAQGTWTEKCLTVWPDSQYIMVEPLEERRPDLEGLKSKFKNVEPVIAALGSEEGTVTFSIYEDLDGSGIGINESGHVIGKREVKVLPVDTMVKNLGKKGPFVLKLDTHGFEVPIFDGARDTLKETVLIIVEVYGFKIAGNSLLFWEICAYLDKQGFRPFDMVDILRREMDAAFWQCDMFFIRKENPVFGNSNYK